ncbi:MAG: hypothetical protein DI603_03270 [Roseateles depolymerans]|uniref:Twin-arginine translocation pathway signal n=1 Tax=Roseateles depolymerans TaxID=76731 RepID=A0A2W5G1I0_9BURK|nr:MAG: hypothetical protein DI603_03270 [Roseateles depolymerans]
MSDLNRRHLLALPTAALLAGCGAPARLASWAQARDAVRELLLTPQTVDGNTWNLAQVLQHLAQSIEYSVRGFPSLKPAWFRHTLGAAAFAVFDARGAMNHALDEPIPGAPALDAQLALKTAVDRLAAAMDAFDAHTGTLHDHFAYGTLSKPQYQRAHLMHLANHWQQFHAQTATA